MMKVSKLPITSADINSALYDRLTQFHSTFQQLGVRLYPASSPKMGSGSGVIDVRLQNAAFQSITEESARVTFV